jgi:hypothetical protein
MSNETHKSGPVESGFNWVTFSIVAAAGALASIFSTGYLVGARNDIYYLPIVDALYDDAQFGNDAFIQSLRYFSSGLWILLSGSAKHINIYWLLVCLNFLSRFISFAGFLACANLLGLKGRKEIVLLTMLLCATSLLRGQSLAGDGGLFINYFTHSEIANGLTLFLLFLVIRGWFVTALVVNGLVFFINAFIGAWDAVMIAAVALVMASNGEISWRELLLKGSIGTVLSALLAAPVLRNILVNPDFGTPLNFDYLTYLEEFWPYHFIFSDIELHEKFSLASMIALGIAAFIALGGKSRLFIVAIFAFMAVYAIGIIAPHVTHSALILNLHLLRVSTMLQLLVVLGPLALATKWWFSEDATYRLLFSPVLIVLLCTPVKMTTIQPAINASVALLVVVATFYPGIQTKIPQFLLDKRIRLNYVALALVAFGFLAVVINSATKNAHTEAWLAEWTEIGNWAKSNTSSDAKFLIPTWNFRGSTIHIKPGTEKDDATINSDIFETVAQRSVWMDFRNGAAVLWSPSYYQQWHQRIAEINSLPSFAAEDTYAKSNGIGYIVDVCRSDPTRSPVFATKRLCVYSTSLKP